MAAKSEVVIERQAFPFRNPKFYPRAKVKGIPEVDVLPPNTTAVSLE